MKKWDELKKGSHKFHIVRNKKDKTKEYCTNIFTLDTEVTSCFIMDNEEWPISFDFEKDVAYYKQHITNRIGVCIIWMFSIDDTVYYGRELDDLPCFLDVLNGLTKQARKFCYVHNLGYDFQELRNVLEFDDVFARQTRKPMKAYCAEYGIEFRDSYVLTNMSLDEMAIQFHLSVKKLKGSFDYNKLRTPKTPLTEEELAYCEHDCLVLYEYIKTIELPLYGNIKKIPMTQTGKMRLRYKEMIYFLHKGSPKYALKDWKNKLTRIFLDPTSYRFCTSVYGGGWTHAQDRFVKRGVIRASDPDVGCIRSHDFTSSYIYTIMTVKAPCSAFVPLVIHASNKEALIAETYIDKDVYAYLFEIKFNNIRSKTYNTYISYSKCTDAQNYTLDNGRVYCAGNKRDSGYITVLCNEHDLDIILKTYKFDSCEVIRCERAFKSFLPFELTLCAVMLFLEKQALKGVVGQESLYTFRKQILNAIYGACCTNYITDKVDWDTALGKWLGEGMAEADRKKATELTEDELITAICDRKGKDMMWYPWGVWISSGARHHLWENIIKMDDFVIYGDTDSLKYIGNHDDVIEENNKQCRVEMEKFVNRARDYLQKNGKLEEFETKYGAVDMEHLGVLGSFDLDGEYSEFRTLGAKKYAYRYDLKYAQKMAEKKYKKTGDLKELEPDQRIHITVSGVNKSQGWKGLNDDMENFCDNMTFSYEHSGRLIRFYCDNQPDIDIKDFNGDVYHLHNQKHGTCLQPTTYVLGLGDKKGLYKKHLDEVDVAYFTEDDDPLNTSNTPHCALLNLY